MVMYVHVCACNCVCLHASRSDNESVYKCTIGYTRYRKSPISLTTSSFMKSNIVYRLFVGLCKFNVIVCTHNYIYGAGQEVTISKSTDELN